MHSYRQYLSHPIEISEPPHVPSLSLRQGGVQAALKSIKCRFMVIGMDSDLLYPLHEQEEVRVYVCLRYVIRRIIHQIPLTRHMTSVYVLAVTCWHTWKHFPRAEDWRRSRWLSHRAGPRWQTHRRLSDRHPVGIHSFTQSVQT